MKNITSFVLVNKRLLVIVLILINTQTIYSQTHNVYFSTGYDMPTTTEVIGRFHTTDSYSQNISTFAKSMDYKLGYQFAVTNNFILDLYISYMPGLKDEKFIVEDYPSADIGIYDVYSTSNIAISPNVQIKFDVGIFSPYLKAGCSINFIKLNEKLIEKSISDQPTRTYIYKGNSTLGLVGGIGTNVIISKTFIGFAEIQLNSLTYYPDKVEMTDYFYHTKIVYNLKENINYGSNDIAKLKEDFPYSSIGFMLGMRIVL
jgi:hypothetical protein